jgi:hypothetical protein
MASSTPHTILLGVNDQSGNRPVYEATADEALTTGELVRWDADDELEPHGTAGGNAQTMFVVENPYAEPSSSTAAIDTDYAANYTARYVIAQRGDQIYAFLADGQNVAKGAALVSDGAGALAAGGSQAVDEGGSATFTIYNGSVVAFADEDKAASGARARIKVRVA